MKLDYMDPFERLASIQRQQEQEKRENAFLNGHGGDRELEYARFILLNLAKREQVSLAVLRDALLEAHLYAESCRLAQDEQRLQALILYVTRPLDPNGDETDYFSMSREEFALLERKLREQSRAEKERR